MKKLSKSAKRSDVFWVGVDDHADSLVGVVFRNFEDTPFDRFEIVPDEKGYRQLITRLKSYGGIDGCSLPRSSARSRHRR